MSPSPTAPEAGRRYGREAFTLTEFLFIFALLGVLLLFVLKGSGSYREKAQTAKCVGHLRQIGSLIGLYASDHRGEMPPATRDGAQRIWYRELYPYMDITSTAAGQSVFACPGKNATEGTGHSYGIDYNATLGSGANPPAVRLLTLVNNGPLTDPTQGRRWLVTDAKWYFLRVGSGSSHPPTAVQLRHALRANVLMPDMSVQSCSREEMNTELYLFRTYPIPE